MINFTSNQPMEHKTAAYRCHVCRIYSMPLTPSRKQKEWATIQVIAQNNFPQTHIQWLHYHMQHKHSDEDHTNNEQQAKKTWTTFTYYSLIVRKIANIFKHTNIRVAFKNTNTQQQLTKPKIHKNTKKSGIYKLTCSTCRLSYMGQTSCSLQQI